MARNETGRTWYGWPTSSSAQRTRVSRASPLPPSGDRSKAVMVMVIVRLLLGENHWLRGPHSGSRPRPGGGCSCTMTLAMVSADARSARTISARSRDTSPPPRFRRTPSSVALLLERERVDGPGARVVGDAAPTVPVLEPHLQGAGPHRRR